MGFKEVASKIAEAAPTLGALFGAPGAAAGAAVKLVAKAFGLKEEEITPEKIDEMLSTDPTAYIKMKEIEADLTKHMATIGLEEKKIDLNELVTRLTDVQSARSADVEKTKVTGKRDWSGEVFDWLITAGFFAILGIRMFIEIPTTQLENVGILLGVLGTAFITVVNFKRGSSQSSKEKTELMVGLTKSNGNNNAK